MSLITSFKYSVSMELVVGQTSEVVPQSSIKEVITNYDYDGNTMPIIYIRTRLSSTMYDKFIKNAENATIILTITKFNDQALGGKRERNYVKSNFIYVMTSNPNYNKSIEQAVSDADDSQSYLDGYIGLIQVDSVNDNRILINTILKNTNLMSIIYKYTKHMTMVIEPFDNTDHLDTVIIPPISSITNLLKFLNTEYTFYKSGYRYFRDFSTTYLLSMNGTPVADMNYTYNTIIINIVDPLDPVSSTNSMELNDSAKAYIINVDARRTSIDINRNTDQMFNSIIGVDLFGNTKQIDLDIPKTPESSEKVTLERVQNNNLSYVDNMKHMVESVTTLLTITKTEIDSSILTPNKEYLVRNYEDNSKYNGRYILAFKKEVMLQQDNEYISSVVFALRKIKD